MAAPRKILQKVGGEYNISGEDESSLEEGSGSSEADDWRLL